MVATSDTEMTGERQIRFGLIGAGQVMDYHHVPGIRLHPSATITAVCDADASLAARRSEEWGGSWHTTDYQKVCAAADVDAVIVATPNDSHRDISMAAAAAGKHVMCEKPLGLSADEARAMYVTARDHDVVHMTAFTYRFAPSMRYMKHLVASGALGTPRHFRSQRFLDWPETSWGWRQYRISAGAGDLFDMTIHRIDLGIDLLGPIQRVCGAVAQFAKRDMTEAGTPCPPSEVDDWSCLIGEFAQGAVGVWEGTTLAKGYGNDGYGHEWAEVNGSEGSAVYRLREPHVILLGKTGHDLQPVAVPDEFLAPSDSPRATDGGDPATIFRYDLAWEFISAILEGRDAVPDFFDGLRAQVVADSVLASHAQRGWVDIVDEPR